MKKILKGLLFIFVFVISISKVSAASATFSVKSSTTTVVVGNNVTVTVTLSSSVPLAGWDFIIGYDTSKLKLVSSTAEGDQRSVNVGNGTQKSVSYKYTFKSLAAGNASVYIQSANVYDFDYHSMSLSKGSATISLKTWAQIEASYSTNADLKSITIDGGDLNPQVVLSPAFDKNTLEYNIELEPDTTEITVNATKADSTASVSGTGKIQVSEGTNKISIVVTAQKGNTKTYVINATVKELEPIYETVDGKNYSVVRKMENMEKPYSYEETTVMIHEIEVPAFYSSITGYKLVGLKDEAGSIKMFVYDETNGTYKYYQELSLNKVILATLSIPDDKIPKGYIKDKITINNEEVECIKHEEFGITLIYGRNIETGKSLFYVYDKEENTLQKYNDEIFSKIDKKIELYTYIILGSTGFIVFLIIILIANIVSNKKKLKKRKEEMQQSLEMMESLDKNNKKERKERDKELKQKQKELEELEKKAQEKIKDQEKKKTKDENQIKDENKSKKKEKKKQEKVEQTDEIEVQGTVKKEEIQTIQEFELETKNEQSSKKKKKNKKKTTDEDDDMFLL